MKNQCLLRARAWMVLGPALSVFACARDGATVSGPAVANVIIPQSEYFLGLGAARQIELIAYDGRNNPVPLPAGITWQSSDSSRVTVDATGNARGIALGGPVTITASMTGKTVSTRVTVRPATVTLSPALDSVLAGQTVQFTATARDAAGGAIDAGPTTWSVTPATAASITPSGVLTAGTGGVFTVTATIYSVGAELTTGVTSQYDGTWVGNGTNSYGEPQSVRFNIRFGSVGLFLIPDVHTSCGAQVRGQYSAQLGVPIVNDRFTFQVTASASIVGIFTSPTTVTGNYGTIVLQPIPCPGVGTSGNVFLTSAYTATKQ
jgi:hypothetical protein